jgi:mRNA interferase RelE/StbE
MTWSVVYHHEVEKDLLRLGTFIARQIVRAIDDKLTRSPLNFGASLSGNLSDYRKLRVGDYRVVYSVWEKEVVVYVLAVGARRDKEVYKTALKRE